jgi:hypothetical protein
VRASVFFIKKVQLLAGEFAKASGGNAERLGEVTKVVLDNTMAYGGNAEPLGEVTKVVLDNTNGLRGKC